jgi:hypothetical protein
MTDNHEDIFMPINTPPISPSDALDVLLQYAQMSNPPSIMLHGAPGIGKSEVVSTLAARRAEQASRTVVRTGSALDGTNILFSDIRLTTIEAQDLRGLPYPNRERGTVTYLRPSFLPPVDNLPHVIFLDELTAAETRLQASAYQLLLDRRVGDHEVGPNVLIVAAGNSAEHGAISNEMGTAIADRLVHLNLVATPDAWIRWAQDNNIAPEVITFIRVKPDFLDMCEKRVKQNLTIGASPRGWARVSRTLLDFRSRGATQATLERAVSGIVGQEAAGEFFLTLSELAEAVDVKRLMEMGEEDRKKNLPRTLNSLYGMVYSMRPLVTDARTLEQAFSLLLLLKRTPLRGLPNEEIATLGFEILIAHGEKIGLMKDMIKSKAYLEYAKIRREQGLQ